MGEHGRKAEPQVARAAARAAAAPGSAAVAPSPRLESRKGGTGGKLGAALCRHWDDGAPEVPVFNILVCFNK